MLSNLYRATTNAARNARQLSYHRASLPAALEGVNQNRFDDNTMREVLDADVYKEFTRCIGTGEQMEKNLGKRFAASLHMWAMDRGARNFAHWFFPMRAGGHGHRAAMKHDGFVDLDFSASHPLKPLTCHLDFSRICFGETDGSSFPNGGLRQTHTAAAFTAWDRTSPPFVRGDTLFFPSAFVTHNNHALDDKTPLLRSQEAVDRQGTRLLKLLGDTNCEGVVSNVGWEQEFFIVDRENFLRRPDLIAAGRMVQGAQPPRGQQSDANYFGNIPLRVKGFLADLQEEMWRCGVSLAVYHNEVAPGQHEISPVFALTNVATDQNTLSMELLEETAIKHGLVCLLHEKPFAGINGSGKHNNWGLNTVSGKNLYVPGKTQEDQRQFMAMVACLARALDVHSETVRVGVATAGNDHRLGAQEAPPAIISLYTGEIMGQHINKIVDGSGALEGYQGESRHMNVGSRAIPPMPTGVEDRNRTAPFPFCGNRFEFRAVGSSQNIAFPLTIINTAVAESMGVLADEIEGGKSVDQAVRDMFAQHGRVIFNGNGYSDEWPVEAEKRGLPNLRNTPEAVRTFNSDRNRSLFGGQDVMCSDTIEARTELMFEQYATQITIEADALRNMLNQGILPACAADLQTYNGTDLAGNRPALYKQLADKAAGLADIIDNFPGDADAETQAFYALETLKPALEDVRETADQAELLVQQDLWPYPGYEELLYGHHFET